MSSAQTDYREIIDSLTQKETYYKSITSYTSNNKFKRIK